MESATSRPPRFAEWPPHPWHGLAVGHTYIEITPFDLIKYEVDKESGYLRVDRPQCTSSQAPALYGFIPRTYCGKGEAAIADYAALLSGNAGRNQTSNLR